MASRNSATTHTIRSPSNVECSFLKREFGRLSAVSILNPFISKQYKGQMRMRSPSRKLKRTSCWRRSKSRMKRMKKHFVLSVSLFPINFKDPSTMARPQKAPGMNFRKFTRQMINNASSRCYDVSIDLTWVWMALLDRSWMNIWRSYAKSICNRQNNWFRWIDRPLCKLAPSWDFWQLDSKPNGLCW